MSASTAVDTRPIAVAPGIWRVGGGSWGGVTRCISSEGDGNLYLLEREGALVLVDAGGEAGREAISASIRSAGHDPASVTDLLLTHSHWDHTEGAAFWHRSSGCRVHLNAVGAAFLARGDHRLVGYQLHGPGYTFEAFPVDHPVGDGEQFQLGEGAVSARAAPGHTPDSMIYTFEHRGAQTAVVGDVVFGPREGNTFVLGQLCSLWLSDIDAYLMTLEQMRELEIDCLLPGHGEPVCGRADVRDAIARSLKVARSLARNGDVRRNLGV